MDKLKFSEEVVLSKIYFIRNQKVMLDRDLAVLYDVKATRLREQVKRNMEKFPEHFMFQLNQSEVEMMVSQNAIPSRQHLGGYMPYVFSEHGLLQLANILKSGRAAQMSIKIIEVFVKMRDMLINHKELVLELEKIRKQVSVQDEKIELIFNYLQQFIKEKTSQLTPIGFKQRGNKEISSD